MRVASVKTDWDFTEGGEINAEGSISTASSLPSAYPYQRSHLDLPEVWCRFYH